MGAAAVKIEEKGEWLSKSAIAKRCGLHVQTVSSRLEDLGYEPDAERSSAKNQIYWFDADGEMKLAILSAKDSVSAMRIRDLRVSAQLKEIKRDEALGLLVSIAECTEIWQRIVARIHREFSVDQPKRLASRLAKTKTSTEVKKIQKADTDRVMRAIKQDFEKFLT